MTDDTGVVLKRSSEEHVTFGVHISMSIHFIDRIKTPSAGVSARAVRIHDHFGHVGKRLLVECRHPRKL